MGVNEPTDSQSEPPPKKFRLQFGLKHLLALPVVVALFLALVDYLGKGLGVLVFLLVLGVLLPRTRDRTLIMIALLLMAAVVLILSELSE